MVTPLYFSQANQRSLLIQFIGMCYVLKLVSSLLRESIYRLLPQTTPENVSKNFSHYSVDPTTRYPNISLNFLKPSQVRDNKSQQPSFSLSLSLFCNCREL